MRWDEEWLTTGARVANATLLEQLKAVTVEHGQRQLNALHEQQHRRNEIAKILSAPFLHLARSDPAASAILARPPHVEPFERAALVAPFGRKSKPFSLTLDYDLKTALPPYDYDWVVGNPTSHQTNSTNGRIQIYGSSGDVRGTNGDVRAACGIGLVVTSDRDALVEVCPLMSGSFSYLNQPYGAWAEARSRCGIDIGVFDAGKLVAGPNRHVLLDISAHGFSNNKGQDGPSCWQTNPISFTAGANKPYAISVGIWIECSHDSGIGIAQEDCEVVGTVNMITVSRVGGP